MIENWRAGIVDKAAPGFHALHTLPTSRPQACFPGTRRPQRSSPHPQSDLASILKYIENRGSTRRVKRKIGVDCSVPESEVVSVLGFTFWLLHFERGETMVWKSQNSRLQTQNVRIDLRVRASN